MRRFFLIISILLSVFVSAKSSEPIKIGLITDVHFLSEKLVDDGTAYQSFKAASGRDIHELHSVFDVVLTNLEKEKIDYLFVSGDLTNHGEKQSHLDFIDKLKPLQQKGIKIFVIPGNHDVNIPNSKAYKGDKSTLTESITQNEFAELYGDFGYNNSIKRDTASLSYLAALNENTWLICFDTNKHQDHTDTYINSGRVLPETMGWALEILNEAKEKGITVLGMMHHGLVEHLPYQSTFFPHYLIDNWKENAEVLADAGLKVVFTGHFHSNDISEFVTQQGNKIYDVETASLVQYPFAYRIMELTDEKLFIDTYFIDSIPMNPNLEATSKQQLYDFTRREAKKRIDGLGIPFPAETKNSLLDVIVEMYLLHVRGDEVMNEEIKSAVKSFAELLGTDEIDSDFRLDFPPADNTLEIKLK